jgi:uncharacterized protein with von Willebrand factor type A (vWA) domain
MDTVLFDKGTTIYSGNKLSEFIPFMEREYHACRGTSFSVPLQRLHDQVLHREIQELQVIFLTDGEDMTISATQKTSNKLREYL